MNETYYEARKQYVESLNTTLAPMQDFDSIHYGRVAVTNEEVIKITDKLGGFVYIRVTGDDLESILKDVARIALNEELGGKNMPNIIQNRQELRELARLFRTEA